MKQFDKKINNYLYNFIFETPDTVSFVDQKNGRTVNLNTMTGQPYVFGFFDAECTISLKNGDKVRLFPEELQRYDKQLVMIQSKHGQKITHFDCILKIMKEIATDVSGSGKPVTINVPHVQVSLDETEVQDPAPDYCKQYNIANPEEYKKARLYNLPQRDVFSPSGRYWDNVRDNKGKYGMLSFWQFEEEITKNKPLIKQLLDEVGVSDDEYNNIYIEFMGNNNPNKERKTVADFMSGQGKTEEVSQEDKKRAAELKAIPHTITGAGKLKNPNFGAKAQADKANKAGFSSVAEYRAKKNPFGESRGR